ncbi:hypothetical protein KB874_04690 [Aestuariicoccus sp. KMU-90]|uniref:Uncharacterized protein n=2 Tax=Thetidibacter halocola TaxID=2827239 RepID=A0A8J8B5Y5_9RHOB|nr:hypothetical protein [Thetidibacter halocola]
MVAAAARAFLVALLVAMPTLMAPGADADAAQMVALLALIAAVLTFVEYVSEYPSLIEFRNAPPFNRMRFLALFLTVLLLSLIARHQVHPFALGAVLSGIGDVAGGILDFPFSPVRLMVLLAPEGASAALTDLIRTHAGLAYLISMGLLAVFVCLVRFLDWPIRRGAFNFWVNLPLFDPTAGGDVLRRLKRDANINIALGFLLPFLIPAVVKAVSSLSMSIHLDDPQTLIWMTSAWAFLPASMIMRGFALMRIAELIEEKRRRAYRQAQVQVA